MDKVQILAIGRDALVLQKLNAFINGNEGWTCVATTDDESAIELFHRQQFDVVLLVHDMEGESVNKFKSIFSFNNPDLILIHHVGDSTAILEEEIKEALQQRKIAVKIVDDVFKDEKGGEGTPD